MGNKNTLNLLYATWNMTYLDLLALNYIIDYDKRF